MPISITADLPSPSRAELCTLPQLDVALSEPTRIFLDSLAEATRANASNQLWWYTWLASRDRLNVRLWDRLRRCAETQYQTTSWADCVNAWLRFAKWILRLGAWIVASRVARRRCSLPADADVVLISVMHAAAVDCSGSYSSAFFGGLPAFLEAEGERVVHCGLVEGNPWRVTLALARARTAHVVTFADFFGFADLVSALIEAMSVRFKRVPTALSGWIADDFRRARGDILQGILIERAMRRLLTRFPSARVIHTYENNPWERACDVAARASARPVLGYLHCAVLPAHFKHHVTPDEQALRPAPDRVICTGAEARRVLLALGAYDPARVDPGCALRDANLTTLPQRAAPPRRIETVLVLLEGLETMVDALRLVAGAAKAEPDRSFLVRAHPSLPLRVLVRAARVRIGSGVPGLLSEAPQASLIDAVAAADAVIYVGSTAAMVAAYMGVPTVKLVLDDTIEDDPMFAAPIRSPRVRDSDELLAALRAIESIPIERFRNDLEQVRAYLISYLAPPSSEAMAVFRI